MNDNTHGRDRTELRQSCGMRVQALRVVLKCKAGLAAALTPSSGERGAGSVGKERREDHLYAVVSVTHNRYSVVCKSEHGIRADMSDSTTCKIRSITHYLYVCVCMCVCVCVCIRTRACVKQSRLDTS